jgi:hypothetical protein
MLLHNEVWEPKPLSYLSPAPGKVGIRSKSCWCFRCVLHGARMIAVVHRFFLWRRILQMATNFDRREKQCSLHNDCDCVALLMLQEFPVVDCMTLCSMHVRLFQVCITACLGPHETRSLAGQLNLYLLELGKRTVYHSHTPGPVQNHCNWQEKWNKTCFIKNQMVTS